MFGTEKLDWVCGASSPLLGFGQGVQTSWWRAQMLVVLIIQTRLDRAEQPTVSELGYLFQPVFPQAALSIDWSWYLNIYFSVIAGLFFIIHFAMRIRTPLEKKLFNDLNFLILQSKSWRSRIPEVVNTIRLSRYWNMSVLYIHAWITPRFQSETFIS